MGSFSNATDEVNVSGSIKDNARANFADFSSAIKFTVPTMISFQ